MSIKNYRQVELPHLVSFLDPELVEGCRCVVLGVDTAEGTVLVAIACGAYVGMRHWLPSEMVACD